MTIQQYPAPRPRKRRGLPAGHHGRGTVLSTGRDRLSHRPDGEKFVDGQSISPPRIFSKRGGVIHIKLAPAFEIWDKVVFTAIRHQYSEMQTLPAHCFSGKNGFSRLFIVVSPALYFWSKGPLALLGIMLYNVPINIQTILILGGELQNVFRKIHRG